MFWDTHSIQCENRVQAMSCDC
uniref:Uncharacterized protein n=1 Tax=Anguilla anguilla TaxID=7936 RepID=A0A0E9QFN3_ANGAN